MDMLLSRSPNDPEGTETRESVNEDTRRGLPPKIVSSSVISQAQDCSWLASLDEQTVAQQVWGAKRDCLERQLTCISGRSFGSCGIPCVSSTGNGFSLHSICDPGLHLCLFESTEVYEVVLRAVISWFQALLYLYPFWSQIGVRFDPESSPNVRTRMASKGDPQKRRPSHSSSQKPKGGKNHGKSNDRGDRPGGSGKSEARSGGTEGTPTSC